MKQGKIQIDTLQKVKDDESFHSDDSVMIRFFNNGTSRVWIDECEVLDPGGRYTEGDLNGPGIDHTYKIQFLPYPGAGDLVIDPPAVYGGNHLEIRRMIRRAKTTR